MNWWKHPKLDKLENECAENLKSALDGKDAFGFVEFDDREAENIGYSDYSYWGSTFRAFSKNKLAVALVFIVVAILLFTFIQPYLPGQFDAFSVNNDPVTGMPMRNTPPDSLHWMGTNSIGQDLWSRLWQGTRTSLLIGLAVAHLIHKGIDLAVAHQIRAKREHIDSAVCEIFFCG